MSFLLPLLGPGLLGLETVGGGLLSGVSAGGSMLFRSTLGNLFGGVLGGGSNYNGGNNNTSMGSFTTIAMVGIGSVLLVVLLANR